MDRDDGRNGDLLGLVIGLGIWLLRGILDQRFAEGSIAPDEYRERREILRGSPG